LKGDEKADGVYHMRRQSATYVPGRARVNLPVPAQYPVERKLISSRVKVVNIAKITVTPRRRLRLLARDYDTSSARLGE